MLEYNVMDHKHFCWSKLILIYLQKCDTHSYLLYPHQLNYDYN